MIRLIQTRDLPRLQELRPDFDWTLGKDFMAGLVLVDESDSPVAFAGAWQRAEVHIAMDATWGTPGARMAVLDALHRNMECNLASKGVQQVVTWMTMEKSERPFIRRLKRLGWVQSALTSFHRKVGL